MTKLQTVIATCGKPMLAIGLHTVDVQRALAERRVAFKNAKDAAQGAMRTATEADGMYYAYLSFAGGGTPVSAEN